MAVGVLVAVFASGVGSSVAVAQSGAGTDVVRIVARGLAGGDIEYGLQQHRTDGTWSSRLLPSLRLVSPTAEVGDWLNSPPIAVRAGSADMIVRVVARRLGDGRVEFALQRRQADGSWSGRMLPSRRFFPATGGGGGWLNTSPVAAADAPPAETTTTTELPPPITTADLPPQLATPEPSPPKALLTSTGVPVAVIEPAEGGYLVRTPCGNTAVIAGGEPIGPVRVVLDPGHGGPNESGAIGPNGLAERDLNLTLADAVLAELADRNIPAATTRTGDYKVQLRTRVAFADALGSEALVSIHHNAPTPKPNQHDGPGNEVYIQSESPEQPRPESARLGGLLYEEINDTLKTFDIEWSGLFDAGVKRILDSDGYDTYTLVRRPTTPAVLVEYGYLSNAPEAELFSTDAYITAASTATATAIEAYLNTNRPGSGFIEKPRTFNAPGGSRPCAETPLED